MSSVQSDILDAIEVRVNATLPTYSRLRHSYNLEANDYRSSKLAYGVGAGSGAQVPGATKSITMDQIFFVVLTGTFGGRSNDDAERTALKTVYDDLEVLYRDLFQSKIGIPASVYLVSELALEDPLLVAENVISVKANFIVKHRKTTT